MNARLSSEIRELTSDELTIVSGAAKDIDFCGYVIHVNEEGGCDTVYFADDPSNFIWMCMG